MVMHRTLRRAGVIARALRLGTTVGEHDTGRDRHEGEPDRVAQQPRPEYGSEMPPKPSHAASLARREDQKPTTSAAG